MNPKTRYAYSDDVCIAYQITGEGPPDVIWAPGTMSHLDMDWEDPQRAEFFERFSKFCRLIRFDNAAPACPTGQRRWRRWSSAPTISAR
jgi:hypothetical protein